MEENFETFRTENGIFGTEIDTFRTENEIFWKRKIISQTHRDLKVVSAHAKIDENFVN